jgi:molecular chaperone DnaJ
MSGDYYEILGINKSATEAEIKKAFRKKAVEFHPDRNKAPDAAEKFKQINEAYQVLSDPKKRQMYDQFGKSAFGGGQGNTGGYYGGQGGMEFDFSGLFGDNFGTFFGEESGNPLEQIFGNTRSKKQTRGKDLYVQMNIKLEDIINAPEKEIQYRRKNHCSACNGQGGKKVEKCKNCSGTGRVKQITRSLFGNIQVMTTCPVCKGSGYEILEKCNVCKGESVIDETHKLKIRIPAGIESGMNIKFSGEGDAGKFKKEHGDLYIEINVDYGNYKRVGDDLNIDMKVPLYSLILGDKLIFETIDGAREIKIPHGTEIDTIISLQGLGVPNLHTKRKGNLNLKLRTEIPKKLSKEEKELFERIKEIQSKK